MANRAIVGIQWGDEGKGRMVDYFADSYDVVVRYQGGNDAGHTVVSEYGKFALNLLPAGIFRKGTVNLLGAGMVIDLKHLCKEIERLREGGVTITPENLKISDRATIVLPLYPAQDRWEEDRLGKDSVGSTFRGIVPAYGDKYMNKALQIGLLNRPDALKKSLRRLIDWKNQVFVKGYNQHRIEFDETLEWVEKYGNPLRQYICDAGELLENATAEGKKVLFEAQLGALRDINYGIYPYSSSSSPLAADAPVGCGMPSIKVDEVLGVVKAYSTCIGEGPFVGELKGDDAFGLREAGSEYGAATGRPRRVAWLDLVATRCGVKLQGATELALTKIDILSYLDEIPVCVKYRLGDKEIDRFPFATDLYDCECVYETLPGWKCDISEARTWEDLPKEAQNYILYIEKNVGCPIHYISVGANREQIIVRK